MDSLPALLMIEVLRFLSLSATLVILVYVLQLSNSVTIVFFFIGFVGLGLFKKQKSRWCHCGGFGEG